MEDNNLVARISIIVKVLLLWLIVMQIGQLASISWISWISFNVPTSDSMLFFTLILIMTCLFNIIMAIGGIYSCWYNNIREIDGWIVMHLSISMTKAIFMTIGPITMITCYPIFREYLHTIDIHISASLLVIIIGTVVYEIICVYPVVVYNRILKKLAESQEYNALNNIQDNLV